MSLTLTCAHEAHGIATQGQRNPTHVFVCKQRVLEVNPQSPFIQDLLSRVKALASPDDLRDPDLEADTELEVTSILIDGALVVVASKLPTRTCMSFSYWRAQSVLIALNLQLL